MTKMNSQQAIGLLGGGAASVAVALALTLPSHNSTAKVDAPSKADLRQAAQVAPSPLDREMTINVQKYFDLALVDASAADLKTLAPDSESNALAKADAYSANGILARVSLVRATKAGTDDAASAELGLRHINQLAWAVEFTDAKEPLFGPADGGTHTKSATLILLLDPADGSFISAAYY